MSSSLVSRSPDLLRLRDEGYDLEIRANYLFVHHVPYVTAERTVAYGTLVSDLSHNGTSTIRPGDHTACLIGGMPHDDHGQRLDRIINSPNQVTLAAGVVADCQFSVKPPSGYYNDYYDKITMYASQLTGYANVVDPDATAKTYPVYEVPEEESVFRYLDAMSSRARITAISQKLAGSKIAIAGVGGTGSYLLDLVAKTPVPEIHLFDGDKLYAHNAFRSPGAASLPQLRNEPMKVDYYHGVYDAMHRHVVPHPCFIDESNVAELDTMGFVFVAVDSGPAKRLIIDRLETAGVPFIEVGIGVYRSSDKLSGTIRTAASTLGRRGVRARIPFDETEDDYDGNIQIAELNALNAALAVMKWKKICGFYADRESEHFSAYSIASNKLFNEEQLA
jgi:hypothetical protein